MGYYTSFDLTFKGEITKQRAEEIVARINEKIDWEDFFTIWIRNKDIADDEVQNIWYTDAADSIKWYDWENDMIAIAKEFPDVEFKLEGNGEDRDDWWIALFKGDRRQVNYCEPPVDCWSD